MRLTSKEKDLLKWLGEEELSQYGECYGASLDTLLMLELAEVLGPETGHDNPFIAKGDSLEFRAVRLTEKGRELLRGSA